MLDLLITNGKVIDGTGNPWYWADVGVKDGYVAAIGRGLGPADQTIDAQNYVVAPGFIDIHTHSDVTLLVDPTAQSAVRQGITTQVIGNCGHSVFPVVDAGKRELRRYGIEPTWNDLQGYARRLQTQGVSINVAPLIGHGAIRAAVLGDANRPPSSGELESMQDILATAMEDGAFGMSSGLIYPPSSFADTEELVALSRIVARYEGIYTSHIRNEQEGVVQAVQEAIAIGEQAEVPVQVSHHKAVGRKSWGLVHQTLPMLEDARRRGVDVTWDQYPYVATSSKLTIFVPEWAHAGGKETLLQRLRNRESRERILAEMRKREKDWSEVLVIYCPGHPEWQGQTVSEIAASLGQHGEGTVVEILTMSEVDVDMVNFGISEDDLETVMQHPVTMIGSDGLAVSPEGRLGEVRQHPRSYGTFPRVLGMYVREKGILSWEEAIRKMTSAPAKRLALHDRGLLHPGMRADVTVFDPNRVIDCASFAEPHEYPKGIEHVIVNGSVVIDEGNHTSRLPGDVLLHGVS